MAMAATMRKVWLGFRFWATQPPPTAATAAGTDSTICHTTVRRPDISFSCPMSAISPWNAARRKREAAIAVSMPTRRPV